MQKNKGITLVALVITIIILLILAGVAISMIAGGDGLFAQANKVAGKYNQAAKNEADIINQLLNGNYTFGGNGEEPAGPNPPTPVEPVPDLIKESNMDFIYKPDTWTNETVNVEITTEITGYTLQYSLDEGETWDNYIEEIPVTTNGKVILARLADGERTGGIATGQVENIDTQGPKAFNLTATADETSITVSADGIVEDADETATSGKSGIRGYQFKLMNSDETTKVDWTEEQTGPSYTFSTGLIAGTTYRVSMKAIDNAGTPTEATNKNVSVTTEGAAINNSSHVRYYADLDPNDGKIDGLIFADLAVGGSGQWGTSTSGAYTIPVKTGLKEYYVSKEDYEGVLGTKDVLSAKAGTVGEDRFYLMALENFGENGEYTWYAAARNNMTDYTNATSVEFGKGRTNTVKMIEYWNNKRYGEQNANSNGYKDIWGEIQEKVAEGWFVPSRAEWAAFVVEFGINGTNFNQYGFKNRYWLSSQSGTDEAWRALWAGTYLYTFPVDGQGEMGFGSNYVRLATTF